MENIPEYLEIEGTVLTRVKKGCTIESIAIPKGVTEIGESAFSRCKALASMTIPESVEIIMFNAFGAYLKLNDVRYGGTKEQWRNIMGQDSCLDNKIVHCSDGDVKEKYSICPEEQ